MPLFKNPRKIACHQFWHCFSPKILNIALQNCFKNRSSLFHHFHYFSFFFALFFTIFHYFSLRLMPKNFFSLYFTVFHYFSLFRSYFFLPVNFATHLNPPWKPQNANPPSQPKHLKYRWVNFQKVAIGGLTHLVPAPANPLLKIRGGGGYMKHRWGVDLF